MTDSTSPLLDRFEKLGLSRNEGLVYLALLKYPSPVTGYQLAKDSTGILRPVAYEMLYRLVEKGGVRVVKGSKDLYSPIAPEIFLTLLEKRFNDAKRELISELNAFRQADKDFYWNISGFDTIIAVAQEIAMEAKKTILFYFNDSRCAKSFNDIFSKKTASGIKVVGFSYRDISIAGVEIYSYTIPHDIEDTHIPENRIMLVADNKRSILGDLQLGHASESSSATQADTIKDFIHMKISFYRLTQVLPPSKLGLYLFEEDKLFLEKHRNQSLD